MGGGGWDWTLRLSPGGGANLPTHDHLCPTTSFDGQGFKVTGRGGGPQPPGAFPKWRSFFYGTKCRDFLLQNENTASFFLVKAFFQDRPNDFGSLTALADHNLYLFFF